MKVLPIGEARRRLPELVRQLAGGHAPIAIGRRGRCEAILAPATGVGHTPVRRPLQGLVEIVGTWEDVERARDEIRQEIERSLDRTARIIAGKLPRRRTSRRRRG